MKKYILSLLFFSFLLTGIQAQVTIKPEHPQPGQTIQIRFPAKSSKLIAEKDVQLIVVNYAYKNPQVIEPVLNKMGDNWVASIPTEKTTLAISYALQHEENWDNNNGEGHFILMCDAKGAPLPESYAAQAMLYRDLGMLTNLNRNAAVALEGFEKAIAADASLERKYLPSYINCTLAAKRGDAGKTAVQTILAKVNADPKAEEADLYTIANAYQRVGDGDKATAIREKLRAGFPDGQQARADRKRELTNEPDLQKREELLTVFVNKFPPKTDEETQEQQMMWFDLCQSYVKNDKWERCQNVANRLSVPYRAMFYNSIAWNMAEKKENLDKAREYGMLAAELSRQELESPTVPKPALQTERQWREDRRNDYGSYTDTYAYTLSQSGMPEKALAQQKIAVEYSRGENPEINERFAQYLETAKPADLIPELERFLAAGKGTSSIKEQFLKAYGAQHGEKAANERLEMLRQQALNKERERLQLGMMNLPATAFSLNNLKGETVSLESLKGKVVIVDFWATWCGPCKASFPAMQKAVDKFKNDPSVVFLFVNTWERGDDKAKVAGDYINSKGFTFNVLMDTEDKVVTNFGVTGIPTKFILDGKGNICFKSVGFSGNDDGLVDELSIMIDLAKKQ